MILADTHALFWWLLGYKSKLSQKALRSLETTDKIIVPTIVLLELLYLLQKKNQSRKFSSLLKKFQTVKRYAIVSLDLEVVTELAKVGKSLEMHDRIIVATATILKIPIVTKDQSIRGVYRKSIW